MTAKQTPFSRMVGKESAPTTPVAPDNETTALVTTEEEESVSLAVRQYSSDAPQFSPDEITVPQLRLAQQMTPEVINGDAAAGQWVIIGGTPAEAAIVIPLAGSRARELYDQERNAKVCVATVPFTASIDSMVGTGEPGGPCPKCPLSQWTEDPRSSKNKPPICGLIYSYHIWDVTHQAVARVDFKSTGMGAAKLINSIIATQGWSNFAVKLGSSQQKVRQGVIYVPTVSIAEVDSTDLATARMLVPR